VLRVDDHCSRWPAVIAVVIFWEWKRWGRTDMCHTEMLLASYVPPLVSPVARLRVKKQDWVSPPPATSRSLQVTCNTAEPGYGNVTIVSLRSPVLSLHFYRYLTPWSWALLDRPPVAKPLDSFPAFVEHEGSLPNSQELSTYPYPEPDQSSPHRPIPPLKEPS
jgi:hypothetical protein